MQLVIKDVLGPANLNDDTLSDVPEDHVSEEEEKDERHVISFQFHFRCS